MATRQKLIHIHSNVYENGAAKAPSASYLEYGEIAVNYNATEPSLFIRDVNDNIRQISTNDTILSKAILGDSYIVPDVEDDSELVIDKNDTATSAIGKLVKVIKDNEEIIASSLNDLNERLNDTLEIVNEVVSTNSTNTSAISELQSKVDNSIERIDVLEQTNVTLRNDVNTLNDKVNNLKVTVDADYEAVEYRQLTASDIVFNPVVANDTLTDAVGKLDTNLSTLVGEVVDIELATSEALNVLREDVDALESSKLTEEDVQEIVSGMQSTLIPGTFISIDESNNIDVKTGTTSSTIAVGNHSHDGVYSPTGHTHTEFTTLQNNINTLSGNVTTSINTLSTNATNSATTLNNAITAETSNRESADTTLQGNIDTLESELIDDELAIAEAFNVLNEKLIEHSHDEIEYLTGHNTSTSLSAIDITKRLVICTVSASGSFSLADVPADGREIHVMVNNSGSSDITVTLPTSGYVNLTGDSITVTSGGWAEINVVSDGSNMFLRAL